MTTEVIFHLLYEGYGTIPQNGLRDQGYHQIRLCLFLDRMGKATAINSDLMTAYDMTAGKTVF